MGKKRLDLEVGRKYRGYGLINEYGEFEFTPEETGSRKGVMKTVKEADGYSIKTTEKLVIVHFSLEKNGKSMVMIKMLMDIFNKLINDFRTYEF